MKRSRTIALSIVCPNGQSKQVSRCNAPDPPGARRFNRLESRLHAYQSLTGVRFFGNHLVLCCWHQPALAQKPAAVLGAFVDVDAVLLRDDEPERS
jgi:hypothetical protein